MLNAMAPPQGPYQQPNNPAGNPILLAQQQQQQQRDSSSPSVPTPSENSSSPVSSSASTTSSSSASTGSATSSPSNLLSTTTTTNQKAITSPQMSATSERLRGCDEKAQTRAKDSPAAKTDSNQQLQDDGQPSADQAERLEPPASSTQPDLHQTNATTTSQDNSSKGQAESQPARISDYASASSRAPPTALSTHQQQSAHSPAGYNPQYYHQHSHHHQQQQQNHNQHNTSNHYKPAGHHSQPYRNSRFNNHISHPQQHHHQQSNHNTQNSHNSIKSSTTNTNSGSFSSIRSRNQRGHNNSHRHNKNNHHQNHNQHHNNHNQQQQSALLTNGNLNNREVQQNLPAPYSTTVASASPAASLSGSDIGVRNSSSSMSRRSAAPTPAGPPHYVEMHVFPGECVAFQLMDGQEQIITGPATMTMVSQQESPPVPIPVQVPPGHTIHQVADESGTLRHIIFSVMNCENGEHMNSNVIDFPHETFRVDSLGELVSTSSNPIGMDGDGSTVDQQATSPSSKSISAPYEKFDPSHHYNMPHHQDTLNMGSALVDGSRGSSHNKNMKSAYKHGNSRQVSSHLARDKSTDFDRDPQQVIDDDCRQLREEPNYGMSGHNLSASGMMPVGGAQVAPEMDPSLMVNFGQMMPPSVEDQIYGYPNCACCCCYCDPNAEAAAAAAAATVVANNQPLNSPAQLSTGSLIGQQDVIMMQQMEPQPPVAVPQHDSRMIGSGSFHNARVAGRGNSMVYQNQHQANSITNPSPHQQQQVFNNHPNLTPTQSTKSASNATKAHTNKAPRGAHQAKQQHGHKSHQSNYDRHHGNYHHNENQLAHNSVTSSGSIHAQQVAVKETVTHKSSPTKQLAAQTNQQVANQPNRSASEEKTPAIVSSPTTSKSPSATTSPARSASATNASPKTNQKLRDTNPTPTPVKAENQVIESALKTEIISLKTKQNYPASDKSTTPRPVVSPSPVSAAIEISVKQASATTSSSSSSCSPNRQPSQSRQSPSTLRSSHHKNQDSTLVNRKSHQSDDATKTNIAPDHQARPQPNSTPQRTASVSVSNKCDATSDDTPSVSSSMTRVTKQSVKVSSIDSAIHQQHQHSKQKQVDSGKRGEETVVASQQESSRRVKQKKQHHNHNQSIKVMSILKQCRNKLTTNTGRVVQNLLSSYSDTKFAGLLLVIFTMFATFLAILIDHYIVAPVTE